MIEEDVRTCATSARRPPAAGVQLSTPSGLKLDFRVSW